MKKSKHSVQKNKPHQNRVIKEKSFDDVGLEIDISEEYRDSTLQLEPLKSNTGVNMSEAQDRSEDLINEVDPFTQEPEKVKKVLRISERSL